MKTNGSRNRVITITSGKGGVGKTNIVSSLAIALAKFGKKVLLLDADLGLGNLDILLGLKPKKNLSDVLIEGKNIRDMIIEGPMGVKILPASSGVLELTNLSENQKLQLLSELESLNGEFDILMIDTGAGISSNVMYFNIAAQDIIVIITPEPTSIDDSFALMKILSSNYDEKYFKVLVNFARNPKEGFEVFKKLMSLVEESFEASVDYLGQISYDKNVPKAVRKQKAVIEAFHDSPASMDFFKIAEKICVLQTKELPKGNIQFFWKYLLEEKKLKKGLENCFKIN